MGIGGIGGYSNYNNYQSTVSQIRLQQALSKNTRYQQSIQAVSKPNRVDNSSKDSSMEFLQSYSKTMSGVMTEANALRSTNSSGVMRDLAVTSSDAEVAAVTERYTARTQKDITLDVSQLAAAQQNASEGVKGSEAATQDMAFSIQGGGSTVNVAVEMRNDNGTVKSNRDMLKEAAKQISASDAGVIATISEKNGVTSLKLTAANTGTEAAFAVTGETGSAKGLADVATQAQNAQYTVTEGSSTRSYTSKSNEIKLDLGKIGATLKSVGETKISAAPDSDKVVSAVSDLVKSYNEAVSFLKDNQGHGVGVSTQLRNFDMNLASSDTLKRLGITTNKEGALVLDTAALKESLTKDPKATKDLLSGSFGVAQSMFNRAGSAMRANSASLVSYDLKEMEQERVSDPIQFMNMYSRSGTYNMNNYSALGLMMNYLV